ncbi:glutamine synthetase/guanido kinase [Gymnopus androsaceus JB14]|uniref:Glutamine synthetase/guanido kinase n=1 Tax=Gymnopus androsaceus JB14 TaxID=1447944 RepID=A0A6A4I7M9_9AGAR|nr:glutamine synthetase/guanido kinase [Gymnopus androsaceus JB14]
MDFSHGIVHTPASIKASANTSLILEDILTLSKVLQQFLEYVRLYFVDLSNTRRCRVLSKEYFKQLIKSNRPGVTIAKASLGLVNLAMAEGFEPIGEFLYALDLSSLRILQGVGKGTILGILGKFEEKDPEDKENGVEVGMCPRTTLSRIIREVKDTCSAEFLIGCESEFILLKSTNPVQPLSVHNWSASDGLLAGSKGAEIMEEIADSLQASGIKLEVFHPESAPGQYEVVTGPLPPLEAADALIYTREIITNVAAKHGAHATFAPRPFMSSPGSSTHVNISVHDISGSNERKKIPNELSLLEKGFLAGLLDHLPAIAAFTLPIPASYKRAVDGVWSGGTYVSWGTENRESLIRLTNPASPSSRRYECRFIDSTANPYLALAAVLSAAMTKMKLRGDVKLQVQDAGSKPAANMSEEERKEKGITKKMPSSSEGARANLRNDPELCEILGKELVDAFLSVNKTLEECLLQDKTEDEQLTRVVEFY